MGQAQRDLSERDKAKFNELFFTAQNHKTQGDLEKAEGIFMELYKEAPENDAVCYELARIYAETEQSEDALFFAERAADLDTTNKWYTLLLASMYRQFNQPLKEIALFERLTNQHPNNPDYCFELANAYLNNEQPKKALKQLGRLEDLIGINEVISDQKKTIYLSEGDVEKAADEIRKLIKAFPNQIEYYGTLGQIYIVNGYPEEAFKVYQKMLQVDPADPRPHLDLANYYKEKEDFANSILHLKQAMSSPQLQVDQKIPVLLSLLDATAQDSTLKSQTYEILDLVIQSDENDPKVYAIYGDFLSRDKRDKEAISMYQKAVSLDGGSIYPVWEQLLLLEVQTSDYANLYKDAQKAQEAFPNRPLTYFFAGVGAAMLEMHQEAVDQLEMGMPYVLGNPRLKEQFYTQLAGSYHELEEHTQSDRYFDKALAINDKNATVLNNYAYFLSERDQQLEKALEMTKKSNLLSPDNPTFLDTYAWVLFKLNKYDEAIKTMEKIEALNGLNNSEVLEHYGDILAAAGQSAKAHQMYLKAKELGDPSVQIEQKLQNTLP